MVTFELPLFYHLFPVNAASDLVLSGGGAEASADTGAAPVVADPALLCCRRQSHVLVAGPRWREAELLGRVPARRAAVLLQPGGELRGHELLLQL